MLAAFSLGILISASITIHAEYKHRARQLYIFKPLTTALIWVFALQRPADGATLYHYAILTGLGFSLGGDIFLMFPQRYFLAGLASFWLGHLAYSTAFASINGPQISLWWLLPGLGYASGVLLFLRGKLGPMKFPVLAYMLVILLMAGQALELWSASRSPLALCGAGGALLFLFSDTALAINRFHHQYRDSPLVVLGSYYCAQWLIALSIGG
ncbi:MAG: lysoplasmalogenase [Chloroflexota bacterium]|nr:lysoplasmalogenase [Chloroflexota bacterium]